MDVDANTIRKGHVVEYKGKLWAVMKSEIMSPGKGAAVVQVEMRDGRLAPRIPLSDRECGAGHGPGDAQPAARTAHERRLSRAQLALHQNHVTRAEFGREPTAERLRLGRAV